MSRSKKVGTTPELPANYATFVQAALAQTPWYHNITLLDKVKDPDERMWQVLA